MTEVPESRSTMTAWQWGGCALSALALFSLLPLSVGLILRTDSSIHTVFYTEVFGYPVDALLPLGIVGLLSCVLYAIPRTAVLGAVLLTGRIGELAATHLRIDIPPWGPVLVLSCVWGGLLLRDPQLWRILVNRR